MMHKHQYPSFDIVLWIYHQYQHIINMDIVINIYVKKVQLGTDYKLQKKTLEAWKQKISQKTTESKSQRKAQRACGH